MNLINDHATSLFVAQWLEHLTRIEYQLEQKVKSVYEPNGPLVPAINSGFVRMTSATGSIATLYPPDGMPVHRKITPSNMIVSTSG